MLLSPEQARTVFEDACERRYALLAVNADSPAAITDVFEAARECRAPIIIETSLWQLKGRSFGAGESLTGLARFIADLSILAATEQYRDVPVIYHTDHIKGPETLEILRAAIEGYEATICGTPLRLFASTLSLDSSEMSVEENVATACRLCEIADRAGRPLSLEVEAGVDDGVTPEETSRAILEPIEAKHPGRLALWAPGVGTQHGLGDATGFRPEAVARQRQLASEITSRPVGIALHGSSGLSDEMLGAAVEAGAVKVNWSSESLLIRSQAAQKFYATHGAELTKRHPEWKATAMDNGVQSFISQQYVPRVANRIRALGGEGRAEGLAEKLAPAAEAMA